MLSWRFEGSNDLINWHLLDDRVHGMHNKAALEKLMRKGGFTTWAIDPNDRRNLGGFNTFRIIQSDENSGKSHVLCLSGIEIYG